MSFASVYTSAVCERLEYFALRYLRVNGVYEVPLELAKDLVV